MFSSIFDSEALSNSQQFFIMAGVALLSGFLYSWILILKMGIALYLFYEGLE